jgi:hypothetical protein
MAIGLLLRHPEAPEEPLGRQEFFLLLDRYQPHRTGFSGGVGAIESASTIVI